MEIDIDFLTSAYFIFDEPVPYDLGRGKQIYIYPITLRQSEFFMKAVSILLIDKNSIPKPEIIQMSYFDFIFKILFVQDKNNANRLATILKYCLHIDEPKFGKNEKGKIYLVDESTDITINHQQFQDIKKIILYQNIYKYDDSYINPEAKAAMNQVDMLKNAKYEPLSLERKLGIISAHTGISKKEQLEMTLRSHTVLFEEVCGEVEFMSSWPIVLYNGNADKAERWIYKTKKNRFDDYFITDKEYNKQMGGDGNINTISANSANSYNKQYNDFSK